MNGKKISAHVAGSALAAIAVWLINAFSSAQVPAEVAVAFGTLFAIIVSMLLPDRMEEGARAARPPAKKKKPHGFAQVWMLVLLAALSGCALLQNMTQPLHAKPAAEAPAVATARSVIDETNAALIALDRAIDANIDDKIWTKRQAQAVFDESKALGVKLDAARKALRLGDPTNAATQAEAIKRAVIALHRRVAEEARKE